MTRPISRLFPAAACATSYLITANAVAPPSVFAAPPAKQNKSAASPLPASGAAADKALIDAIRNDDSERVLLLLGHGASAQASDDGNESALSLAAEEGNAKIVRALLDKGAPVQGGGEPDDCPLISAIDAKSLETVRLLLAHKASLEATPGTSTTPLIAAIQSGAPQIVDLILQQGADINAARKDGRTPLVACVAAGNITLAKRLISSGAKTGIASAEDNTPLIVYAASTTPEAVQFALDQGDKIDDAGRDRITPLMAAADAGNLPVLDFLIAHHASLMKKDSQHRTALLFAKASRSDSAANVVARLKKAGAVETPPTLSDAIARQDAPAIRKLLEKPETDPNVADEDGMPPLFLAAQSGDDKTVKVLLDKGANPNAHDPAGRSILAVLATIDDSSEFAQPASPQMIELLRHAGAESPELDLVEAIEDGDSASVEALLQKGVSASAKGAGGKSALATAVLVRHDYAIADRLLKAGAKVNGVAADGATVLGDAAASGDTKAVRYLLDHGADPNVGFQGNPPMTLLAEGDPKKGTAPFDEMVRLFIDKGASVNGKMSDSGPSFLMIASEDGSPELLQFVLNRGARADINFASHFGETALINAAAAGRAENVEILLKYGAAINRPDKSGMTPLMWAVRGDWQRSYGNLETVKVLLAQHPRLDVRDETGRNALMIAEREGNFEIAGAIRKAGGKRVELDPQQELFEAIRNNDISEVRRAVNRGANVNSKDPSGDLPLHDAAFWGYSDIAAFLIAKGAKVMGDAGQPGGSSESPLHTAMRSSETAVAQVLLRAGAPADSPGIGGETPLMLAAEEGNIEGIKLLLAKGANVRKADEGGLTALMRAAVKGHRDVVALLLARGADVNAQTKQGYSALLFASESFFGSPDIISALLDAKANVNLADADGQTPLMLAAREGKVDVIEVLLQHGAKVQARDTKGKSALDYADERDLTEAKRLLRKAGAK